MKGLPFMTDGIGSGNIEYSSVAGRDFLQVKGLLTADFNSDQYLRNYRVDIKIVLIEATSGVVGLIRNGSLNVRDLRAVEQVAKIN